MTQGTSAPTNQLKLSGKVAIATGAARGLGRAYALHLAGIAADVVVNNIDMRAAAEYGEAPSAPTVKDEIALWVVGRWVLSPM